MRFQKTMLDESSAHAIDRSRVPTSPRNVKFSAAARDIQAPVGIIRAKNISMPGLKHCQMWGSLRAFIRLIFFSQLWLKRNLPFNSPIMMPRIGARYLQIDWGSIAYTFLISTPPLNSNDIPPPYQIIAAVNNNVRWETFICGFRFQGSAQPPAKKSGPSNRKRNSSMTNDECRLTNVELRNFFYFIC